MFFNLTCSEDTLHCPSPPAPAWEGPGGLGAEVLVQNGYPPCLILDALPFPRSASLTFRPHQTGARLLLGAAMCFSSWKAEQDRVRKWELVFQAHAQQGGACARVSTCVSAHSHSSPKRAFQTGTGPCWLFCKELQMSFGATGLGHLSLNIT